MSRKKEYLLIDGYNVIFSWSHLENLSKHSLESARKKLVDELSDYKGTSDAEITVVFDAHKVKKNYGAIECRSGIKIVYTKEHQTADNYIEEMAAKLISKTSIVKVVTSDNLEQVIVITHGAYRITAKEFYYEIKKVRQDIRNSYIENKPIKNNLLINNIDAKTAELLEKMRMNKED